MVESGACSRRQRRVENGDRDRRRQQPNHQLATGTATEPPMCTMVEIGDGNDDSGERNLGGSKRTPVKIVCSVEET